MARLGDGLELDGALALHRLFGRQARRRRVHPRPHVHGLRDHREPPGPRRLLVHVRRDFVLHLRRIRVVRHLPGDPIGSGMVSDDPLRVHGAHLVLRLYRGTSRVENRGRSLRGCDHTGLRRLLPGRSSSYDPCRGPALPRCDGTGFGRPVGDRDLSRGSLLPHRQAHPWSRRRDPRYLLRVLRRTVPAVRPAGLGGGGRTGDPLDVLVRPHTTASLADPWRRDDVERIQRPRDPRPPSRVLRRLLRAEPPDLQDRRVLRAEGRQNRHDDVLLTPTSDCSATALFRSIRIWLDGSAPGRSHDESTATDTDPRTDGDRKSTRLNSSHLVISYAV